MRGGKAVHITGVDFLARRSWNHLNGCEHQASGGGCADKDLRELAYAHHQGLTRLDAAPQFGHEIGARVRIRQSGTVTRKHRLQFPVEFFHVQSLPRRVASNALRTRWRARNNLTFNAFSFTE